MAEFQTVMREFRRLCEGRRCADCPIREKVDKDMAIYCSVWVKNHSEEAENIIMQWAAEHPVKTNRDKFKEIFGVEYYDLLLMHGYVSWLDEEYKEKKDGTEQ